MKAKHLLFTLFFIAALTTNAQPVIEWQKCLGGTAFDIASSIQQTPDGGYIVAGQTESNDGDVTGNHGSRDSWIVKLNSSGVIEWQKCLGGTDADVASSIHQTADGGYIVGGTTSSNDSDVTGNHGLRDYWIVKLSSVGFIEWQKCLGGTDADIASSIQQTVDGGYIVAGQTSSNDGDVTGNHGSSDYWIVKLNSTGVIEWQKCLGGRSSDYKASIQQTADGGFIVAGATNSNDGYVTCGPTVKAGLIFKLNSTGAIEWQKCLGEKGINNPSSIQLTTDSGYIVAGHSNSTDCGVTGINGVFDEWIVKLNRTGVIEWQKCLGGTGYEYADAIQQTVDGGYIVAGITESNDGDVTSNHGLFDEWIVKLNSTGIIEWQKCLGGTGNDDYANAIQQTADGGFIVAGTTNSDDGDVTGNHGISDFWIVKLSPLVGIKETSANEHFISLYPNPANSDFTIHTSSFHNEMIRISIMNVLGEILQDKKLMWSYDMNFNIQNLSTGIYFLQLIAENGSVIKKFVKE